MISTGVMHLDEGERRFKSSQRRCDLRIIDARTDPQAVDGMASRDGQLETIDSDSLGQREISPCMNEVGLTTTAHPRPLGISGRRVQPMLGGPEDQSFPPAK